MNLEIAELLGNSSSVGIGQWSVSSARGPNLATYSLGSCVGLTLYDPVLRIGGMLHGLLPFTPSGSHHHSAGLYGKQSNSGTQCDGSTVQLAQTMLDELCRLGAHPRRLVCYMAGGATIGPDDGVFRIGDRNVAVLRHFLEVNGLSLYGEDVGGSIPRSMYMQIASGRIFLRSNKEVWEL